MGLTLEMLTRNNFVPENGVEYAAFLVSDFYGELEFKYLTCEFTYNMIDADNGYPLPCSACYEDNDLPCDVPILFKDKIPCVISKEEVEKLKNHHDPEQRFWWIKTWFLTDHRNTQIHPEELDEISIGIMKVSDFMKQVKVANSERRTIKESQREDCYGSIW